MTDTSLETRDRMLEAATELFAIHGFDGVSVRMIAEKANANISLVSYYFGGKEGLYKACLDTHGKAKLASIQRILVRAQSADEVLVRLEMLLGEMIHSYLENPYIVRMIHKEFERQSEFTKDIFQETFVKIFESMLKFFQDAVDDGFLRTGLDPFIVCSVIMGSVNNAVRMDQVSKCHFQISLADEAFRQKFLGQLKSLFGYGLLKQ